MSLNESKLYIEKIVHSSHRVTLWELDNQIKRIKERITEDIELENKKILRIKTLIRLKDQVIVVIVRYKINT